MRYAKPILLTAMLCSGITLASCSTALTATGCSELARGVLMTPTPYPALTNTTDPLVYGVEATGAITKANDDKATGFRIINVCEVRDAEILAKINRPWWRPF